MVQCRIKLEDNDQASYCAGDLLKGTIELDFSKRTHLRGLSFVVFGAARCHWTKAKTVIAEVEDKRRCRNKLKLYDGDEVFINHKAYLFGYETASPVEMPNGSHRYDFSCHLPPSLPASFEGRYGCIQYYVQAFLDMPLNQEQSPILGQEFKLPFTVVRFDDLNKRPDLRIPVNIKETETFCCFCCRSEPMTMNVTMLYSGFAPGQRIPVTVNYVNKSNVEILRTHFVLKRSTRYTSTSPKIKMKTEEETIAEAFDYDGLGQKENASLTKSFLLPQILPNSNAEFCKTVQISYELKVIAETSGFNFDVSTSIPITIGTVPLKFESGAVAAEIIPFVEASAPPDIPPPAFNEGFLINAPTAVTSPSQSGVGWKLPK